MKSTTRLEAAIQKLYAAFCENTLHPECCRRCAVGTLLDGTDVWKHLSDHHGSLQLNYVGKVHQSLGKRFNGYTPQELLRIETAFLRGCGYQLPLRQHGFKPSQPLDKEILFDGLCNTVDVLYRLEGCAKPSLEVEILLSTEAEKLASKKLLPAV
ncbi:MAG: Na(+)-translocating NADH-quinone reductase subunit F [Marinirhabdus sp.]|nr:Na(+)-translocating NADH-quinone reductase subunit F [Marinirhabdus sp.]